jgi:hypothetical protein
MAQTLGVIALGFTGGMGAAFMFAGLSLRVLFAMIERR